MAAVGSNREAVHCECFILTPADGVRRKHYACLDHEVAGKKKLAVEITTRATCMNRSLARRRRAEYNSCPTTELNRGSRLCGGGEQYALRSKRYKSAIRPGPEFYSPLTVVGRSHIYRPRLRMHEHFLFVYELV